MAIPVAQPDPARVRAQTDRARPGTTMITGRAKLPVGGFFSFYYLFPFFTKIYFRFVNLQKYTPAAPQPGGRDPAAGRQGLIRKKKKKKYYRQVPGDRPPGSGAAGPPPLYKVLAAPHPLICLTKNPEKRKEREGGRGGVRERQSGEALSDFQAGDFR